MTDPHSDVAAVDHHAREVDGADLFDLSAPQPNYKQIVDHQGGIVPLGDAMLMAFNRDDVDHILKNHQLFSSRVEMGLGNVRPMIPLNVDPPNHSKYRKLLDPLFAPRRMDEQEEAITELANELIDGFIERGWCNFTEEYAEQFPSLVFLRLLGLPDDELGLFLGMRDGILHPHDVDPAALTDFDRLMEIRNETGQQIYAYFGELIERRRASPSDDIVSRFLAAEVGGDKLSDEDILDIMFLFVIAGLDTVSDSLTCLFAYLAQHPDHLRQIVEDPDLIPSAVEELLRWESPVPSGVPRVATEDTELPSGHVVPKGTACVVSYGSADIDEDVFGDPFAVRFDREHNPHIAFGAGVHRCLGSHLARRELRITLREWIKRIPEFGLKPGHETLEYPPGLRHVKDLTLSWS